MYAFNFKRYYQINFQNCAKFKFLPTNYEHVCPCISVTFSFLIFKWVKWYQDDNLNFPPALLWASLVAQTAKNLPAVQETMVLSLGWEEPLEKEIATHSSILALRIPWTEEPGELRSMGSQRVGHNWATNIFFHFGIL